MGAGNHETRKKYYNIIQGRICERIKDPATADKTRENYRTRQTEDDPPRTIHEYTYSFYEGVLMKVVFKDPPKGTSYKGQLELHLSDGQEFAVIQMSEDSGYATAFLKCIEGISVDALALPIKFSPTYQTIEGTDKKRAGMFVQPFGQQKPVKWVYTKNNPGACPPLEKVVFKGKEEWDNTKQMAFLKAVIADKINPLLETINGSDSNHPAGSKQSEEADAYDPFHPDNEPDFTPDTASDDLPF